MKQQFTGLDLVLYGMVLISAFCFTIYFTSNPEDGHNMILWLGTCYGILSLLLFTGIILNWQIKKNKGETKDGNQTND